jgi:hypothetical protein
MTPILNHQSKLRIRTMPSLLLGPLLSVLLNPPLNPLPNLQPNPEPVATRRPLPPRKSNPAQDLIHTLSSALDPSTQLSHAEDRTMRTIHKLLPSPTSFAMLRPLSRISGRISQNLNARGMLLSAELTKLKFCHSCKIAGVPHPLLPSLSIVPTLQILQKNPNLNLFSDMIFPTQMADDLPFG